MPVYKYQIAMFYIYLYMSIYIYSHTLQRHKKKRSPVPKIGFYWTVPEPSGEGARDSIST